MGTGLGLVCVALASVFFGSNFVVTKKYPTGDGMFFQLIMCCGVFLVGFLVNIWRDFPEFQPIAMLGGAIWATGNVCVVPIVKTIGLSLGLLLWGMVNMLAGWASGHFGYLFLDLKRQEVEHPAYNYAGVGLVCVALAIFSFIKPSISKDSDKAEERSERTPLRGALDDPYHDSYGGDREAGGLGDYDELDVSQGSTGADGDVDMWVDRLSPGSKKAVGVALSVFSGFCYGINFDPPQYVIDHVHGSSQNSLDYVYSHFTGIFFASFVYFVLYCVYTGNKPTVYREICLPGVVSGMMWAVAQTAWFVANQNLEFVVAFPLITTGPGLVGAMWGVFVFGEIKGWRNYRVLLLAIALSLGADLLIVLSHPDT